MYTHNEGAANCHCYAEEYPHSNANGHLQDTKTGVIVGPVTGHHSGDQLVKKRILDNIYLFTGITDVT